MKKVFVKMTDGLGLTFSEERYDFVGQNDRYVSFIEKNSGTETRIFLNNVIYMDFYGDEE